MKGVYLIQANEAYVIKGVNPEMYDAEIVPGITTNDYILNMIKRGWKTWNWDHLLHVECLELSLDEFMLIMQLNRGEVFNFNPFIKVAVADIDNEVPEGLPHRTYTDYTDEENPVEVIRTWRTWRICEESYPLTLIDGFYYFVTNTFFDYLTGTELMIIHNSSDAELVDSMPSVEDPL